MAPEPAERVVREGARVLVVARDRRMLVLRAHDPHQPSRSWWFTPGGGLEAGETPAQAAVRELAEETGIVCGEQELVGPVWERTAFFDFMSRPYVQHELIYLLEVDSIDPHIEQRWTAAERDTIDEIAWLAEHELREAEIEVFPLRLRESWDEFLAWNGETVNLGEVDE
ncbi:NUDIX hydrolase [Demequina salsinemoris]|uniref:NUDIX hydrolase n=1 Tax=Demequina salsinemoris TaxID=577470 RepID=UPI000783AC51|nr:NUDIX domain-containing protein [Demequina salsinemoris]